jgi:hypothetical protein
MSIKQLEESRPLKLAEECNVRRISLRFRSCRNRRAGLVLNFVVRRTRRALEASSYS